MAEEIPAGRRPSWEKTYGEKNLAGKWPSGENTDGEKT